MSYLFHCVSTGYVQSASYPNPPPPTQIDINTPPVLDLDTNSSLSINTTVSFPEVDGRVRLLAGTSQSLTDLDSTIISQAIVMLLNRPNGFSEYLELAQPGGIVVVVHEDFASEASSGTLSLFGNFAPETFLGVLGEVYYVNTDPTPSETEVRTVSIVVMDDSGGMSEPAFIDLFVEPYNDPPVVHLGGPGVANYTTEFTEGGQCVVLASPNVQVSDPDSLGITSISVRLDPSVNDESITIQGTAPATIYFLSSTEIIIVLLNTTFSAYEEVLTQIVYCNNAVEPDSIPHTISVVATDLGLLTYGNTSSLPPALSDPVYASVAVSLVNDPPSLSIEPAINTGGSTPTNIVLLGSTNLTDVDSTRFSQIRVSLSNAPGGASNEIILFDQQLPLGSALVGPVVDGDVYIYTYTFGGAGATRDDVSETIDSILYQNTNPTNDTLAVRRICIEVSDFELFSNQSCVDLNVVDSSDNAFPPVFSLPVYHFNVTEVSSSIVVGQVGASDLDVGRSGQLVYTAESTSPAVFEVDFLTGVITAPLGLDADGYDNPVLTVIATDLGNPSFNASSLVVVEVNDTNDNAPQFIFPSEGDLSYSVSIPEGTATNITFVKAMDADAMSPNNMIEYFLIGAPFDIDSETGDINIINLDAETEELYTFIVIATDNGAVQLTSTASITITVTDINDNPTLLVLPAQSYYLVQGEPPAQLLAAAAQLEDVDLSDASVVEINVTLTPTTSEEARPYNTCLGNCQDARLSAAGLIDSIALYSMAEYFIGGANISYPEVLVGEGNCSAIRLARGAAADRSEDTYGKIPNTALPMEFGAGEYSVSFVANIRDEGFVFVAVDTDDTSEIASRVNFEVALEIRSTTIVFEYIYGVSRQAGRFEYTLSGTDPFNEFFSTSVGTTRHYTIVIHSNPTPVIVIYVDCSLLVSAPLDGTVQAPDLQFGLFLGQSQPSPVITGGRLDADIHGLYYHPYALNASQIADICLCGEEYINVPTTLPSTISRVVADGTRVSLTPSTGLTTIPLSDVVQALRQVEYANTFFMPNTDQPRYLEFTVTDIDGLTNTLSTQITFVSQEQAPQPLLDLNGADEAGTDISITFTEAAGPIPIVSTGATLTWVGFNATVSTFIEIAVELLGVLDPEEVIAGYSTDHIMVVHNNASSLQLVGPGSASEFLDALQSLTYDNTNPQLSNVQRQLSFTVYDTFGGVNLPVVYTSIAVESVNQVPQISDLPASISYVEGSTVPVAPELTISDSDSDNISMAMITISSPTSDNLMILAIASEVNTVFNALLQTLTITGEAPISTYQELLRNVQFSSSGNPPLDTEGMPLSATGNTSISISIADAEGSMSTTAIPVNFQPVNNPPIVSIDPMMLFFNGSGQSALPVAPSTSISDPDSMVWQNMTITLNIAVDGDYLADGSITSRVLIYGQTDSLEYYTAILTNITYDNPQYTPTPVSRSITVEVCDFQDCGSVSVSIMVDPFVCQPDTCLNGGDCIEGPALQASCSCEPRFTGESCEVVILISLDTFTLDLDIGQLSFFFSFPVNTSTLNISAITLQDGELASSSVTLTGANSIAEGLLLEHTLVLLDFDLNAIKADEALATNEGNTYLSLNEGVYLGTLGYPVSATPDGSAQPVSLYTADNTSPEIVSFDLLGMPQENVSLAILFSETVNPSSLSFEGITLLASLNSSTYYQLTGGSVTIQNSPHIEIFLELSDVATIREAFYPLGSSPNATYLSASDFTISDTAGNFLIPIPSDSALQAAAVTADFVPPTIDVFSLDMNTGILSITFSEEIEPPSLNLSQIFLHDVSGGQVVGVSTGTISTVPSTSTVDIILSDSNLDSLKIAPNLASVSNDTFLTAQGEYVADMVGNTARQNVISLQISEYVYDTTSPFLQSFTFDLNAGEMTLSFSEPVDVSSIAVDQLVLTNARVDNGIVPTFIAPVGNLSSSTTRTIGFSFSNVQLNQIKQLEICLSSSTCYLYFPRTPGEVTGSDYAANILIEIPASTTLQATDYFADVTPPELIFFQMDLDSGTIDLSFSETVDLSSFNLTQITLQSSNISTVALLVLTGGSLTNSTNGDAVQIIISPVDLNGIKALTELCTSPVNCHSAITQSFVTDISDNTALSATLAADVDTFVYDTTAPFVTSFDFNLTVTTITLYFVEVVDAASFQPNLITIQNAFNSAQAYSLTGGNILTTEIDAKVEFTLTQLDVVRLQANLELATGLSDTFLSFPSGFVVDTSGNPVQPAVDGVNPIQVNTYTPDFINPYIISVNLLDMNTGLLNFSLSEPISGNIEFSAITICSVATCNLSYTLTSGINTLYSDPLTKTTITFELFAGDLIAIKVLFPYLATSVQNSFIAVALGAFRDTTGNDNVPVPLSSAQQVLSYSPDTASAFLTEFTLDLNNGQLNLVFDDVISADSMDPTGIAIQSGAVRDEAASYFELTGGTVISGNGLMLTLVLTAMDFEAINSDLTLASTTSNTFIAITEDAVSDVAGNSLSPILPTAGLQASMVIFDNPLLFAFDFDLDSGTLTLSFSETVDHLLFNTTGITLLNMRLGNHTHQLTGGTVLTAEASNSTVIELSNNDLNSIKALPRLAAANSNTYISVAEYTVADLAGNALVPVPSFLALQVTTFTDDTTQPQVVSFGLRSGSVVLALTFTETVDVASVDPTGFTILQSPDSSNAVTLTGGSFGLDISPLIEITLSVEDVESIRGRYPLGTSPETTYLNVTPTAATDVSGNIVSPPSMLLQVSAITADLVPPEPLHFTLDVDSGNVVIDFSEDVLLSGLTLNQFLLQDALTDPTTTIDLAGSEVFTTASNSTRVEVQLPDSALDTVKVTDIGVSISNAYITVLLGAISDTVGNPTQPTTLQATELLTDITPPSLNNFSLNLDSGQMFLSFSEPVLLTTLQLTDLVLAKAMDATGPDIPKFAPSTSNASLFSTRGIAIEFSTNDLNELKRLEVCVWKQSCYLHLSSATTLVDYSDLPIQAIPPSEALQVNSHTLDMTQPTLLSFETFDLNAGTLEINFSETINATSFLSTELILQNFQASSVISSYTLTGGVLDLGNTVVVTVTLSSTDLNAVKADELLCTSESTCFAQFSTSLVTDVSGNLIATSSESVALSYFEFDTTPPRLLTFDLDMNTGLMTLYFDETVDSATFRPDEIVIQNSASATASVQLSIGTPIDTSVRSTTLSFNMLAEDIVNLQIVHTLATGRHDSFLTFSASMISDTSGTGVQPSLDSNPVQVRDYFADMTPPQLLVFSLLDMDQGIIELSFSEPVTANMVDLSRISLCSAADCSIFATLSDSSSVTTTQPLTVSLQITLSFQDLRTIKRQYPNIGSSIQMTWISVVPGSFVDAAGNSILPAVVNVNNYLPDQTQPNVLQFQLDVNTGRLTLDFDDVISSSSTMANFIRIQRARGPSFFVSLSSETKPSVVQPLADSTLELVLAETDLSNIRLEAPDLATSTDNTYMSVTVPTDAFLDVFGNKLNNILQINALQASSVTQFLLDCQNGGTFVPGNLGCECVYGFNGTVCENDLDFCLEQNPCNNGGTCMEGVGADVSCSCTEDYVGAYCDFRTGKSCSCELV